MAGIREEVRVVREVLEGSLSHEVATRVMFEALAGRAMPKEADDVLCFVRGPLALRLRAQVGADSASAIVAELDAMLVRHATTGSYVDVEVDLDEIGGGEPSVTKAVALAYRDPVPVLVAAASDQLALLCDVSLGPSRVRVTCAPDEATLRRLTFAEPPLVALLDGEDPPHDDPAAIASALGAMPAGIVRVVWAADAPGVAPITRILDQRGSYCVRIARADGIDPLLDLVRSRRKSTEPPAPRS